MNQSERLAFGFYFDSSGGKSSHTYNLQRHMIRRSCLFSLSICVIIFKADSTDGSIEMSF